MSASRFAPTATGANAMSVEQCTEDRDLYEAIVASLLETRPQPLDEDDDGAVRVRDPVTTETRSSSSRKRKKKPYCGSSVTETGQPSNSKPSPSFICEICAVARRNKHLFCITGCGHACCNDCVANHVALKLRDNVTGIHCPVSGCGGVLEPGYCSSIVPPEVFDRWCNALTEALILEAERFHCPFKDCSALLINDGDAVVRDSECPNCRRLFCAQCRVPWHAGLECQEFQGLNEREKGREDMMIQLPPSSSSRKPKRKEKPYGGSLATETDRPLNSEKGTDDIMIQLAPSSSSRKPKRKEKPYSGSLATETDQPSNSKPDPSFICEICIEPRTNRKLFHIKGCSHTYCNDCVAKYIASKLHDNVTHIGCPVSDCSGVLEPEYCRSILPPEVFDRWCNALTKALILEAERFYCPFKDCSALLINDGDAVVRDSECLNCRRLFCAQCRVPWHAGLECQEFQGLNEGEKGREDMMIQLPPSSSSRKPKRKEKPYGGSLATETDQPLNSEKGTDDIMIQLAPSSSSRKPKRKEKPYSGSLATETDQPSNSKPDPSFICEICIEPRTNRKLFHVKGCSHTYCNDCIAKYIASKLHDNVTHIGCPVSGCSGVLEPEYCRSILPPDLFDRWGNALCEALILEGERFYCPFKDCSALLINDGGAIVRESECPNCRRLFCAECRVPWHAGVKCQEMKEGERGREDKLLMKLAEKKHWRRCPKCRFFVQKISGCAFVKCRCGVDFCYRCGAPAKESHYCTKCRG